jgi:hypothetical protein
MCPMYMSMYMCDLHHSRRCTVVVPLVCLRGHVYVSMYVCMYVRTYIPDLPTLLTLHRMCMYIYMCVCVCVGECIYTATTTAAITALGLGL